MAPSRMLCQRQVENGRVDATGCFWLIFVPAVFSLVCSLVASLVWDYLLVSRIRALSFVDQGSDSGASAPKFPSPTRRTQFSSFRSGVQCSS
jgi:hypothetical protein